MESWSMFTIGAPPDEDNNPMKWYKNNIIL